MREWLGHTEHAQRPEPSYLFICMQEATPIRTLQRIIPLPTRARNYILLNIALLRKRDRNLGRIPMAVWSSIVEYAADTRLQLLYAAQLNFFSKQELKSVIQAMCDSPSTTGHSELTCTRYRLFRMIKTRYCPCDKPVTYLRDIAGPPLCPRAVLSNKVLARDTFLCSCGNPLSEKAHLHQLVFTFASDNAHCGPTDVPCARQHFVPDSSLLATMCAFLRRQTNRTGSAAVAGVSYVPIGMPPKGAVL